jgi:YHS domain-containing protein
VKKVLLLTAAALALSSVAFADPPKTIKCAVMPDHEVNIKEATGKKMFADYKGNRYFFCCAGCPGAFKKEPAKFAKAPHIKTPKAPKKKSA